MPIKNYLGKTFGGSARPPLGIRRVKVHTMLFTSFETFPGRSNSIRYFRTGMCQFMVSISTLSENFNEKVGPFRKFYA